jgi:hypothetical protein
MKEKSKKERKKADKRKAEVIILFIAVGDMFESCTERRFG